MNYSQYKPKEFKYRGKWIDNWFSNMVPSEVTIDGITYKSVENYYQSMKSTDASERQFIIESSPSGSKSLGRKVKHFRRDWEQVKYEFMKKALRAKFAEDPWRKKLLDTGDEIIIEWTNWNDPIWGVDSTTLQGDNLLGNALMDIRNELKNL